MEANVTTQRIAWSFREIADLAGLSVGFLRNEAKKGRLPIKRFGRRVLVLDKDLKEYLAQGSQSGEAKEAA